MLIPLSGLPVREYDVVFTVTPTSRQGHNSDSIYLTHELYVVNNTNEKIQFPFVVLSQDPGSGAQNKDSVEPKVTNGSRPVELSDDEIDNELFVDAALQRARQAGVTDAEQLEQVRAWARLVLGRAERTKRGRTTIDPNESRRIVVQQRQRLLVGEDGTFELTVIAPTPLANLQVGGRVSVVGLLPWEDEDVRPAVVSVTQGFELEQARIKQRQVVSWHWRNDPVFELRYRYN